MYRKNITYRGFSTISILGHLLGSWNISRAKKEEILYLYERRILFALDKYPELELLDHMVVIFFNFRGTCTLFSTVATPLTVPPTVHEGFLFSTSLPALAISCFYDDSCANRCELISHCGLTWISLIISDVEPHKSCFESCSVTYQLDLGSTLTLQELVSTSVKQR